MKMLLVRLFTVASVLLCDNQADRPLRVGGMRRPSNEQQQELLLEWRSRFLNATGLELDFQFQDRTTSTDDFLSGARVQLARGELDVVAVDCVYPGALASDLITLETAGFDERIFAELDPFIMKSYVNTDGEHLGASWYNNFGILFYRADLLQKYGFAKPPAEGWSYEEFENISEVVRRGEQVTNPSFDAYIWPGDAYEGGTCFIAEVVASHGGEIITSHGEVVLNSVAFKQAIARMNSWVQTKRISPYAVNDYRESDIVDRFCKYRNVMFARNWPYMIARCNNEGMAGMFGVVRNPGLVQGSGRGSLGGWSFAIGKHTPYKEESARFIESVSSYQWQLEHYNVFNRLSTRKDIMQDTSLCDRSRDSCIILRDILVEWSNNESDVDTPHANYRSIGESVSVKVPSSSGICPAVAESDIATICDVQTLDYVVARPSTQAGSAYPSVSAALAQIVRDARIQNADTVMIDKYVENLECTISGAISTPGTPAYCQKACGHGRFRNATTGQCRECLPHMFSKSVALSSVNQTADGYAIFFTAEAHHLDDEEWVTFLPTDSVSSLANRSYQVIVWSATSLSVTGRFGEPVQFRYVTHALGLTSVSSVTGCRPCPAGTQAPQPGSSICQLCEVGKYFAFDSRDAGSSCIRCPIGEYADVVGASSCKVCDRGTTRFMGSVSPKDCVCPDGEYSDGAPNAVCRPCPDGMTCPIGSDVFGSKASFPRLQLGYWAYRHAPLDVYMCGIEQRNVCGGGLAENCTGGHLGFLCTQCPDGFGQRGELCLPCASQTKFFLAITFVCIGAVLAIIGIYQLNNKELFVNSTADLFFCSVGGTAITAFQITGMFAYLNVPWYKSHSLQETLSWASAFAGSPHALSADCLMGNDPIYHYLLYSLVPCSIMVLLAACHFISLVFARICCGRCRVWEMDRTLNTLGTLFSAFFITFTTICASPIAYYRHPNGEASVSRYPSVILGDSGYWIQSVASSFMLLTSIIPYACTCVFAALTVQSYVPEHVTRSHIRWRSRSKEWLHGSNPHVRYRFLFHRFRPRCFWWGNVLMLRQVLLAFAPALPASEPHLQALFVSVVLICYAVVANACTPWKSIILSVLDIAMCTCLAIFTISSMAFMPSSRRAATMYGPFMLVVLGFLCALLAFESAVACVHLCKYGKKATIEQHNPSIIAPAGLGANWKVLSDLCIQLSPKEIELLLNRMPATDWYILLECVEAWHGLAPHIFPTSSNHRLVGVKHSLSGSSGEDTQGIIDRLINVKEGILNGNSYTCRADASGFLMSCADGGITPSDSHVNKVSL